MKRSIPIVYLSLLFSVALFSGCKKKKVISPSFTPPTAFEEIETGINGNVSFTDLSFINSQEGVICGGSGFMVKTTDGGKTWLQQDVGTNFSFRSTSMLNQQEFLVSGVGLHKTNNAGTSFYSICDYLNIKDFHYFNSDTVVIVDGRIHKTVNGGQTWELKYDSLPFMHACQFLTDMVGYARGGTTFDATSYGQIVKTIDGGETWNVVYSSSTSEPLSMSFVNKYVGYFITKDKIYKTMDGGLSWNLKGDLPSIHNYVYFISPTEGYLSSPLTGELLLTRDSGEHWELVYTAPNINQYQNFIFKMQRIDNIIYAIGTSGLFLKSK